MGETFLQSTTGGRFGSLSSLSVSKSWECLILSFNDGTEDAEEAMRDLKNDEKCFIQNKK